LPTSTSSRTTPNSRTLPEINASHATPGGEYEIFHPSPGFVEELLERGVEFAVGTDAHDPGHFAPRRSELAAFLDERVIDPASPLAV
jgi:histidinol-phosphatase (PHP family)